MRFRKKTVNYIFGQRLATGNENDTVTFNEIVLIYVFFINMFFERRNNNSSLKENGAENPILLKLNSKLSNSIFVVDLILLLIIYVKRFFYHKFLRSINFNTMN